MFGRRAALSRRTVLRISSALAGAGVLVRARPEGAGASGVQATPVPVGTAAPRLAATVALIDRVIAEQMARDGTPGVALALTDRRGVILARAYGYADLGAKAPVRPETLFEFGSIGKGFTAVVLLQLAEHGAVDLHAPVRRYLPWFSVQSADPPITLHHLLTHTGGLIAGSDFSPGGGAEVWGLRNLGVSGPPGASFTYSNVGYKALGLVIEAVTGKPYRVAVQERILGPLGMTGAANAITSDIRPRLAVGYAPRYDDRPPLPSAGVVPATWIETTTGDGSLAASATDLTAYLRMLLNGGASPHGRLLSPASFELMRHPYVEMGPGVAYGYGLMLSELDGQPQVGHTGGMLGYTSSMIGVPEAGLGAIALINGPGNPIPMATFALRVAMAAMRGASLPAAPAVADPTVVEDTADYAGTCQGAAGTLRVEAAAAHLQLVVGGDRVTLQQRPDGAFLADHPAFALFPLRFARGADGRVAEVTYGPDWYRGARYAGPTTFATPPVWAAFPGHYRSHNPWNTNFRVGLRKGQLWLFWPDGREETLEPAATGFRPTADAATPLRLTFDWVADGQALRARWNDGDDFLYRFFTP